MSSSSHSASAEPPVRISTGGPVRANPAEIDASCRWPVLALVAVGLGWLVVAGLLGVIAAVKLHAPGFLAGCAWLTYGRIHPAAWHAFVYGFASPTALGVALWMLARLSGVRLVGTGWILLGAVFWNFGVKVGILLILTGHGTGLEGLEFPAPVAWILLVAYVLVAAWGILAFTRRAVPESYISVWYLLGALFSFPWVLSAGTLLGVTFPLRGVLQAAVQAWFVQNLLVIGLGFVALAVLFYLLPKLSGQAVPSRNLALFGFWTLAIFGSLAGLQRYQGGPFPAWMISLGVVAGVLLAFPVMAVLLNLWGVARSQAQAGGSDPAWRFARTAWVCFVVYGGLSLLNAFPASRRLTHFTLFTVAMDQLFLLGFVAFAFFAAVYHLVPALLGRPWSEGVGRWHYRLSVASLALWVVAFAVGGLRQGLALADPEITFILVVRRYLPFASMGTLASLVFLVGNVGWVGNLAVMIFARARSWVVPVGKDLLAPQGAEVRG